ncbi:MAG: CvpA family protein [Clostridia bacterium]
MFVLDLILIALIVLGAISGHKKGLVGVVVGFASLILSIILAFAFQSVVSDALYESGLGKKVKDVAQENMQNMLDNGESIDNSFYGSIISSVTTEDEISKAAEAVSRFVMKGLSFIAIFLIVRLICYILQMILNIVFNLPILSSINSMGGTAVGVLSILIKVWIILAIISFISPLPLFEGINAYIDNTFLVKLLYNNNLLVTIIKAGLKI